MIRGRKPKPTTDAKPYIKCSLELETQHIATLEDIKRQLGTDSRSEALRAIFDSGVLADVEFCFETDDEITESDPPAADPVTTA